MSDKRKLSTILGVCGATVLASGGSIFLTDTGLSLIDQQTQYVQSTETEQQSEKETEQPLSVKTFASTDDFFAIDIKGAEETEPETEPETEKNGENKTGTETKESESEGSKPAGTGESEQATGIANPDTTTASGNYMYAGGYANVRDMAGGEESQVIGVIPEGEAVTVTGNVVGNWVEVQYGGKTGYVYDDLLYGGNTSGGSAGGSSAGGSSSGGSSSGGDSSNGVFYEGGSSGTGSSGGSSSGGNASDNYVDEPSYYVESVSGTMYATTDVNVRSTASKYGSRLGGISAGQSISVTGYTDNGWIQVSYDGQTGYVSSNYLSWDGPSSGGSSSGGGSSEAWDDSYMYDTSSYYLTEDELSGWSASDLAIMRNEIFARHGREFTSSYYNDYFSQKTWYEPTYDASYFDENMDSFLNEYEWANLELIQKMEDELS